MRTTIDINDELYRQAKELAVESGRALRDVIEDALRMAFRKEPRRVVRRRLPVSKAVPGVRPGADIDNSAALLDLMEGPDAAS